MTTFHPREPRGFQRREFLTRSALGALGLTMAPSLLAACGGSDSGTSAASLELARPDNPVKLPLFDDNPMIASGLDPEQGTLKVYNYVDYLWKKLLKDFAKEYGVKWELTTFATMDEAIAKLSSGATDFDVFFPTPDRLSRLAAGKLLQPLNKEYIPNLSNMWPVFESPFYDVGAQYTVPYTVYSTGIGYRTDKVKGTPADLDNPYDFFWNSAAKGKVYVLNDSREALSAMLLRDGVTDVNTEDPAQIDAAKNHLIDLTKKVNVKYSEYDYTNLSEDRAWIHQAWSGSMISAPYYLDKGVSPEVLGYWWPPDGRGLIGSDTMGILKSSKNPVLAHHFLNFMLEKTNSFDNFYNLTGYQPPLNSINPDSLVADEVVPANLATAVVRPPDFDKGYQELELSPDGQVLWQNAWAEFQAG